MSWHRAVQHQGRSRQSSFGDKAVALYARGKIAEALVAANKAVVGVRPDVAMLNLAAACHVRLAEPEQAISCWQRAVRLRPDYAEVYYNLGNLLRELRRYEEAEAAYRQAVHAKPDYAGAYNNLGVLLHGLHRYAEAEDLFRQVLQIQPDNAEACNHLGTLMHDQHRTAEAEAAFRQALQIQPDDAEVHNNLGSLLYERNCYEDALVCYQNALRNDPDCVDAHNNLGNLLKDLHRPAEAEASYRQALRVDPACAEAYNNLGTLLQEQQQYAEAEEAYRQALRLEPNYAEAHYNLGSALIHCGQVDEGIAHTRQAIAIQPDYAMAHHQLAWVKRFHTDDADWRAIEAQLAQGQQTEKEKVYLYYAAGKACADRREPEQAFRHYAAGAGLKRKEFQYDIVQVQDYFAALRGWFTTQRIQSYRGGGCHSPVPIFIIGMPRSGTTLVEQILASHTQVHGAGELHILPQAVNAQLKLSGQTYMGWLQNLTADALEQLGQHYVRDLMTRAEGVTRITDKMPYHFTLLGLIVSALPNAHIIHVQRNPLDTCFSCFTTLFSVGQEFSYDLKELGLYYRAYADLMAHWRTVLPPGSMLEVQYEQLVANPEPEISRLLSCCGLEWQAACLDFHHTDRPVQTASAPQVRQPLYKTSVDRWQAYRYHLEPLLDALGPLV
ncbi:MAG: tetratricopeptide repeat protein [Magnetococcales bacterium]|nr:tetratricopeptide repeat protein [Magnetococcales bacterium]